MRIYGVIGLLALVLASGCGWEEDDASQPDGDRVLVEEYYDNGQLAARGYADASGARQDLWEFWRESGQQSWVAHYAAGRFDASRPWTEYNADGSIRADHTDGAPIGQTP